MDQFFNLPISLKDAMDKNEMMLVLGGEKIVEATVINEGTGCNVEGALNKGTGCGC